MYGDGLNLLTCGTVVECPTPGPLVRSCLVRGMLLVYIRLWHQRQWEMYGLCLVPSRTFKGSEVPSRTFKGSEVPSRTLKGSCFPGSADTLLPPSLPVVFRFLPWVWCVVLRSSVCRSAPCSVRCPRGRLLVSGFSRWRCWLVSELGSRCFGGRSVQS